MYTMKGKSEIVIFWIGISACGLQGIDIRRAYVMQARLRKTANKLI